MAKIRHLHVNVLMQELFDRDSNFIVNMFEEFNMDDFTVRDLGGPESCPNYLRFKRILERFLRHGVTVYSHVSPTGLFVLDLDGIWRALCFTLAKAYVDEQYVPF